MKALLLAAGEGTRLRPITEHIPKCMVPINGRPLISYWIDLLFEADIESILINTHYLSQIVVDYIDSLGWGDKIKLVHEEKLLGTAGTIFANKDFFEGESFMVIHADNLSRFNVHEFLDAHKFRPEGSKITMMTFETDSPSSCGIVVCDSKGLVVEFYEKKPNPPGNLANGAVYILDPEVIGFISTIPKDQFPLEFSTAVLPYFIGEINTFHNNQYHRDIGTPESYKTAQLTFEILTGTSKKRNI